MSTVAEIHDLYLSDREPEAIGGKCSHPSCLSYGEGCRAYTPASLAPHKAEIEAGKRLVAEGWQQVSRKGRIIRRWKPAGVPTPAQLLRPEVLETPWGKRAAYLLRNLSGMLGMEIERYDAHAYDRVYGPPKAAPPGQPGCGLIAEDVPRNPLIEERTLSPAAFAGFRLTYREPHVSVYTIDDDELHALIARARKLYDTDDAEHRACRQAEIAVGFWAATPEQRFEARILSAMHYNAHHAELRPVVLERRRIAIEARRP